MISQVYLIKEVSFDSMENRDARYSRIIGFVDDVEAAHKYCSDYNGTEGYKFTGWDGHKYPYVVFYSVDKIDAS